MVRLLRVHVTIALTVAVNITKHGRGNVDGENIVAKNVDERLSSYVMSKITYASVKKPTPATIQTLAWNQLKGRVEDGQGLERKQGRTRTWHGRPLPVRRDDGCLGHSPSSQGRDLGSCCRSPSHGSWPFCRDGMNDGG